jgi:hypothetical protein
MMKVESQGAIRYTQLAEKLSVMDTRVAANLRIDELPYRVFEELLPPNPGEETCEGGEVSPPHVLVHVPRDGHCGRHLQGDGHGRGGTRERGGSGGRGDRGWVLRNLDHRPFPARINGRGAFIRCLHLHADLPVLHGDRDGIRYGSIGPFI